MESFEDESERLLCDLDTFVTRRTTYGTGHRSLEATRKRCNLGDENEEFDGTGWLHKPIAEWRQEEAIHWLMSAYWNMGQLYRSIPDSLILSGKQLLSLSKEDFEAHDRVYGGRLYDELHSKQTPISLPSIDTIYPFPEPPYARLEPPIDIDRESHSSVEEPPKRRKPRPPGPKNHTGKLWEFIRDLLQNRDTCPSLICWEDYSQAKFRFVKSDEVAKRWGSRKGNKKMTYEKLSRAMRYYYKSSIFLPVLGRRLVYQFGPNAKGWQTDNPNFRH